MKNFLEMEMTDSCNLKCDYCYERNHLKPPNDKRILSYEESLECISKYREQVKEENISVELFGGEPLLAMDTIKKLLKDDDLNKNTRFSIITNSTIYDDELVNLIVCRDINIEFSLDPPRTHDLHRKFFNGENSFNHCFRIFGKYYKKFKELDYKKFRVRMTYHGETDEIDIYQHILFFKNKGIGTFVNLNSGKNQLMLKYNLQSYFLDIPLGELCCGIECYRCFKDTCPESVVYKSGDIEKHMRYNIGAFKPGLNAYDLDNTGDRFG